MSDLEKFKPDLPPRLVFARYVAQMREQQLTAALASLSLPESEKQWLANNGEVYYLGQDSQNPDLYSRQSPKFPTRIWGADEVSLGMVGKGYYEDAEGESVGIAVHLYRDGSPYVPEEIVDDVYDPSYKSEQIFAKNRFMVTASHDGPPAIVHTLHEKLYSQEVLAYTPVIAVVDVKAVRPDVIHYLDDDECSSIMSVVESAELFVDPQALVEEVEIWLR